MAGSEISQKRKKHIKSRVFVPEDSGIELAGPKFKQVKGGTHIIALTDVLNTGPHGPQHNKHAASAYTCLNTIPNTDSDNYQIQVSSVCTR